MHFRTRFNRFTFCASFRALGTSRGSQWASFLTAARPRTLTVSNSIGRRRGRGLLRSGSENKRLGRGEEGRREVVGVGRAGKGGRIR